MKRISFRDVGLKYVLSPFDPPVVQIDPGETVVIEVEDAASGQIRRKTDRRDRRSVPFGNPVVGPIYIKGAKRGSSISVSIIEIKPSIGQGTTYFSEFNEEYVPGTPILKFLGKKFPREPKICKIQNGQVYFSDELLLPYRPMIGTLGVAPHPEEEAFSSGVLPGRHGGNMDLPDVCSGSTVFLPVFHEGALLYIGDAHAVQGDGEISGTAVEMPAEVKIKVDVKDEPLGWPMIENKDEVMFVSTTRNGASLENAIRTAFLELALWIEKKFDLNRFDALMLCSQIGKIRIGNLWTAAAKIEKKYLEALMVR